MLSVVQTSGPMKPTRMVFSCNLNYAQVQRYLEIAEKKNFLERTSDGEWQITAIGAMYLKAYLHLRQIMGPEEEQEPLSAAVAVTTIPISWSKAFTNVRLFENGPRMSMSLRLGAICKRKGLPPCRSHVHIRFETCWCKIRCLRCIKNWRNKVKVKKRRRPSMMSQGTISEPFPFRSIPSRFSCGLVTVNDLPRSVSIVTGPRVPPSSCQR